MKSSLYKYNQCSKTRRFGPLSRRLSALRTVAVAFHPYPGKKLGKKIWDFQA